MIIQIIHIATANQSEFVNKIKTAVAKMQNECALKVEIQYQTTPTADETPYIVYSALVIGREIEDPE